MEKGKILGKNYLKGPRTAAGTKDSILSVDTLNAYVHNHRLSPTPQDLKLSWDNVSDFVEALWTQATNT